MNPFHITDKDKRYNVSSGALVPPEVKKDVLRVDKAAKVSLICEQIKSMMALSTKISLTRFRR